jgi:hypothetical protein
MKLAIGRMPVGDGGSGPEAGGATIMGYLPMDDFRLGGRYEIANLRNGFSGHW